MSFGRRIWIAVQEATLLALGPFVAAVFATLGYSSTSSQGIALLLFILFEAPAILLMFHVRSRHRDWKIRYEAEKYERRRAWTRTFPERARWRRAALRVAVWLPSLLAAFVLFFLPAASHVLHLGGIRLGPYKLTVPWNVLIVPGPSSSMFASVATFAGYGENPLGITHSFRDNRLSASMTFTVYYAPDKTATPEQRGTDPTREFKLGPSVLQCWEDDLYRRGRWISCHTSSSARVPEIEAWFTGDATRIPLFYKILGSTETALK